MLAEEVGPRSRTQGLSYSARVRVNSVKPVEWRLIRCCPLDLFTGLSCVSSVPRNHRMKVCLPDPFQVLFILQERNLRTGGHHGGYIPSCRFFQFGFSVFLNVNGALKKSAVLNHAPLS